MRPLVLAALVIASPAFAASEIGPFTGNSRENFTGKSSSTNIPVFAGLGALTSSSGGSVLVSGGWGFRCSQSARSSPTMAGDPSASATYTFPGGVSRFGGYIGSNGNSTASDITIRFFDASGGLIHTIQHRTAACGTWGWIGLESTDRPIARVTLTNAEWSGSHVMMDDLEIVPSPVDRDGDGIPDNSDNCPDNANPNQANADGDARGDVCDTCPNDADNDGDDDGVCGDVDNCPEATNSDQADQDNDGAGDVCDVCPADELDDSDGDGSCDSDDLCDGSDDRLDADSDGVPDGCDNCPNAANPDQTDTDGDLKGDACDVCPLDAADDSDGDSVCDSSDVCPGGDDLADADADAVPDACDNCVDAKNEDQADQDGDLLGDACDTCPLDFAGEDDLDEDGVCNTDDVCDGDDASGDTDEDGVCDDIDPCFGDNASGDADADGHCLLAVDATSPHDCDDTKAEVYPGAPELCDGLDNACAGAVPDEDADADADGKSICEGDCADDDATRGPDATETCNGLDDDCDGTVPDDETDGDSDGVRVCEDDCADDDATVYPGATEVPGDAIDQDCDGADLPAEEDTGTGDEDKSRCGCATGAGSSGLAWFGLAIAGLIFRRRR